MKSVRFLNIRRQPGGATNTTGVTAQIRTRSEFFQIDRSTVQVYHFIKDIKDFLKDIKRF